ncbi:flavin-containing monooxygenase [Domibacillus epiphyticus]|uniref:Oxidoreductase n=1 Tax=Domibacillus epiphyticus TaxID=1714355 RepID=A0A1V2A3Q0_9BACI|nr:NAD(P)/FAD-dependent oxidoreductase [Domibacillus epiphyticus]OMP65635.1 oxidoreductase [Domibacillus epiphyticus]
MYQTVIIGGGQAGLAIGYYLKRLNQSFIILDKNEHVGDEWRKRYDSLALFTPRMYSSLPGLQLEGDPNGFPVKDEIAHYLKKYAELFQLPIQHQTEVTRLWREHSRFQIETNTKMYEAEHVIIASGPFQKPYIPDIARNVSPEILQLHSSARNPGDLIEGNVLVIGGGNSGAQISLELSNKRETYLSTSQKIKFLPLKIGSKSIFWWFDKAGIYKAPRDSWIGKRIRASSDPIIGTELKDALASGAVVQKKRVVEGKDSMIRFQDQSMLEVQNIIWCTGFVLDYEWMEMEGALDDAGQPIHKRGVSQIEGLYYLGLPWQYRRGSALLLGVGEDAEYIAKHIEKSGGRL